MAKLVDEGIVKTVISGISGGGGGGCGGDSRAGEKADKSEVVARALSHASGRSGKAKGLTIVSAAEEEDNNASGCREVGVVAGNGGCTEASVNEDGDGTGDGGEHVLVHK